MKKKLLFLIILLIPFMVNALDVRDFKYKWSVENENEFRGTYNLDDAFVSFNEDEIVSVNKITGEQKNISFPSYGTIAKAGNSIIIFKSNVMNYNKVTVTAYDGLFNKKGTNTIDDLEVLYGGLYDDDYAMLVGQKERNGEYYLKVYFFDENGNIAKTDELKTFSSSETRGNKFTSEYPYFVDFNNNAYSIKNYKITPMFTNSDGTRMYLTNDHLYKVSSTGEEIDSVEIPNGKGTRMAKKDNKYYVLTASYTIADNKTTVVFTAYLIDEDLNILKTNTITPTDKRVTTPGENGFNRTIHSIFNAENTIYYNYQYSEFGGYSQDLDENLEPVSTNHYYYDTFDYYSFTIPYDYNDSYRLNRSYYHEELFNDEYEYYDAWSALEQDEFTRPSDAIKINDNYVVSQVIEENNSGQKTYKVDLVYLNSSFQEVYRKTIYDSSNSETEALNDWVNTVLYSYDNHIVAAISGPHGIKIGIYDQNFELVNELYKGPDKYNHLAVYDIYGTDKELYVSLSLSRHASAGVSEYVGEQNTLVLPESTIVKKEQRFDIQSLLLCFSRNFIINKHVTGKGTIASALEEAGEGEMIRFTVTPEPGYVLSMVKVTDANGNVLTFTDNTFVMPASDVTIEAIFVPKNPNTGDIAILIICLIALSMLPIFAFEKRRLNALK